MDTTQMKGKKKVTRGPRSNQKLKILYLMKLLQEETDEEHALTMSEILELLEKYEIRAERKSVYRDIEVLREFGLDIVTRRENYTSYYYVASRDFELAELKMLVDCVQAAKFIPEKQSLDLIQKLEGLASRHQAKNLDRQVYVPGRVKTINRAIYYSIDAIHEAISEGTAITFQYFQWNLEKEMELRHGGRIYHVFPWTLCWDDEKYYMVAYDNREKKIKHFRVDKMTNTTVQKHCRCYDRSIFPRISKSEYTSSMFGMYGGETMPVTLLCENEKANIIFDRFGKDISVQEVDEEYFQTTVTVSVSNVFLGWIFPMHGVQIVSPQKVIERIWNELERLQKEYMRYRKF